ncbi:MAG: signal peptidase II [Acidimicrobiia bacterium]|nr:signal peptidase II [Acidimicrobiia bacterium]
MPAAAGRSNHGDIELSRRALAALVAVVALVLDQITKIWAVAALSDGPYVIIDGFLRFAEARNPGASFSTFTDQGQIIGVIAIGVIAVVFVLADRVHHTIDVVGLGLIMGGAAGNLADRIFRGDGFLDGAVVDFIDFDFFPSFNVADTAINIGVGLLLIGTFVLRHGEDEPDDAAASDAEMSVGDGSRSEDGDGRDD